ncbi:hypothetical protein N9283_01015 [Akkermansiaceae bacterium]|nr:hypothetical protein [Akkermansiaceae bacterium]
MAPSWEAAPLWTESLRYEGSSLAPSGPAGHEYHGGALSDLAGEIWSLRDLQC